MPRLNKATVPGAAPGATSGAAGTLPDQKRPLPGQRQVQGAPVHRHAAMTTSGHVHLHAAFDGRDDDHDGAHEHRHSHDGDADHDHDHTGGAGSAKSTRSWNIQHGDRSPAVPVNVPVLAELATDSAKVITRAGSQGQLDRLAKEIAAVERARAASAADLPGKAAHYEQLAAVTADPGQAQHYRSLAKQIRDGLETAGVHRDRAALYERRAAAATSGPDRSTYLELARLEREKASA